MQNLDIANDLLLETQDDGSKKEWKSRPIPAALNANYFVVYLVATDIDSDTRLSVTWGHSGDGEFFESGNSGAAIIDSTTAAEVGLVGSGDSGTEKFGGYLQFKIGIEKTSGTSRRTATVRLVATLKPF